MHAAVAIISVLVILWLAVRSLSDPFYGLLAFMCAYDIQPGELYRPLAVLHLERVLAVVLVVSFIAHHCRLRFPPLTRWLLALFGAMLIGIPFAFWRLNSALGCVAFFEVVFYHLMLVALVRKPEHVRKVVLLLVALVGWLGASAVYDYHNGIRQFAMGIDRAEGLTSSGGDPNTLAITMVATMPLMFLLMVGGNRMRTRLFALGSFGIALVTVITTGSRTAFLGFVFLLLVLVFRRRENLKYLPLLVLSLPLLWLVIPQQYKKRYESVETRNQDESYTDRLLSWQGGVHMFLHNPLTGVGIDNYTVANGKEYWPNRPRVYLNAHSLYFKVLGELGLSGVVTFGGFVIVLVLLNRSLRRRFLLEPIDDPVISGFGPACNLAVLVLLFAGYTAHDLYRPTWYTFGAVSAAVSLLPVAEASRKRAEQEAEVEGAARIPAWSPDFGSPAPVHGVAAPWLHGAITEPGTSPTPGAARVPAWELTAGAAVCEPKEASPDSGRDVAGSARFIPWQDVLPR